MFELEYVHYNPIHRGAAMPSTALSRCQPDSLARLPFRWGVIYMVIHLANGHTLGHTLGHDLDHTLGRALGQTLGHTLGHTLGQWSYT